MGCKLIRRFRKKRTQKATEAKISAAEERKEKFVRGLALAKAGEPVTKKEMANYLSVSEKTVQRCIAEFGYRIDGNTFCIVENTEKP